MFFFSVEIHSPSQYKKGQIIIHTFQDIWNTFRFHISNGMKTCLNRTTTWTWNYFCPELTGVLIRQVKFSTEKKNIVKSHLNYLVFFSAFLKNLLGYILSLYLQKKTLYYTTCQSYLNLVFLVSFFLIFEKYFRV
jgi:hypothetical protein